MDNPTVMFTILACSLVLIGVVLAIILICIGYWMGRNSAERPFRSDKAPRKVSHNEQEPPIDEPEGDIFNESAFGDDDHVQGIPTMTGSR